MDYTLVKEAIMEGKHVILILFVLIPIVNAIIDYRAHLKRKKFLKDFNVTEEDFKNKIEA